MTELNIQPVPTREVGRQGCTASSSVMCCTVTLHCAGAYPCSRCRMRKREPWGPLAGLRVAARSSGLGPRLEPQSGRGGRSPQTVWRMRQSGCPFTGNTARYRPCGTPSRGEQHSELKSVSWNAVR